MENGTLGIDEELIFITPNSPLPKLNTFKIILLIKVIFPKIYQVRA
jgi:hypothetical protein